MQLVQVDVAREGGFETPPIVMPSVLMRTIAPVTFAPGNAELHPFRLLALGGSFSVPVALGARREIPDALSLIIKGRYGIAHRGIVGNRYIRQFFTGIARGIRPEHFVMAFADGNGERVGSVPIILVRAVVVVTPRPAAKPGSWIEIERDPVSDVSERIGTGDQIFVSDHGHVFGIHRAG